MTSTTRTMHDVAIAGGGPAGLHAAALLAARGFDVAVFEEHHSIGEPVHCTGLIAAETYDEFDLPTDSVLNELLVVRFYPPSGEKIEYATARAEALVVDRQLFDQRLAERARDAGVGIRLGTKIRRVEVGTDAVWIDCADRSSVRARALILACGANYSLHRRLGLGLPAAFLQSAQLEVPATRPGPVEVHFGDRVAPKGFAWAVPVDWRGTKRLRIGLMCQADAASRFKTFHQSIGARHGVSGEAGVPRLKMLPLAPIERTFGNRLVAVGDAAGLVKATTGGGVHYGLVSAQIAADVLADALRRNDLGPRSLSAYETGWRKRLGAELEAQLSLRTIAQRLTDDEIEGLFDLARNDGVMPIIRRTARFNQHRDLIVSLLKHPPVRKLLYRRLKSAGRIRPSRLPQGASSDVGID